MRFYFSIITLIFFFSAFAQEEVVEKKVLDSLYREDQFYLNFTYNSLNTTNDNENSVVNQEKNDKENTIIGFL